MGSPQQSTVLATAPCRNGLYTHSHFPPTPPRTLAHHYASAPCTGTADLLDSSQRPIWPGLSSIQFFRFILLFPWPSELFGLIDASRAEKPGFLEV